MIQKADVVVLGAGMAGASAAAHLAPHVKVILAEAEDQPGRHATGRSAAMFFETYGNLAVRALVRASREFLLKPPEGFAATPLMNRRDALFIATEAQLPRLKALRADSDIASVTRELNVAQALAIVPILRPDYVAGAVLDTSGYDMDVDALFQGFLRSAKSNGARLMTNIGFDVRVEQINGTWQVHGRHGTLEAPVLINAGGAWADEVAQQAGVPMIGLQPLRRSALIVPAPRGTDTAAWPLTIDVDEQFYFKPEAGHLLISPANEDPSPPCDAVPDELDIAIAIDRYETATRHQVDRILHRWSGLRSFVVDRTPVVGFADEAPGFFWLAGQGGYGIEIAPALGALTAALVLRREPPPLITAYGVDVNAFSPRRLRVTSDQQKCS